MMLTRSEIEEIAKYVPQFVTDNMADKLLAHDAALRAELHDAKTQCGKNAISHMNEYHRAEGLAASCAQLEAALRSSDVEWSMISGAHRLCPWCKGYKTNGHYPTCVRQQALKAPSTGA